MSLRPWGWERVYTDDYYYFNEVMDDIVMHVRVVWSHGWTSYIEVYDRDTAIFLRALRSVSEIFRVEYEIVDVEVECVHYQPVFGAVHISSAPTQVESEN